MSLFHWVSVWSAILLFFFLPIWCRSNEKRLFDYLTHIVACALLNSIVWLLVSIKKSYYNQKIPISGFSALFALVCVKNKNNNTLICTKPKSPWSSCCGGDKRLNKEEKKVETSIKINRSSVGMFCVQQRKVQWHINRPI